MSKRELMDKAREFASCAEKNYGNCAQSVLGSVKHTLDSLGHEHPLSEVVFKAAAGLAAGVVQSGSACGAVTGAILAVGAHAGRDWADFSDRTKARNGYDEGKIIVARFQSEYGSQNCWDIHKKLFGRSYDIAAENEAFVAAGAYNDENCPRVCGDGAAWAIEVLYDAGYIKD